MFRFENRRVHLFVAPASRVAMTSWVRGVCSQGLLNVVSVEEEFYTDQYLL